MGLLGTSAQAFTDNFLKTYMAIGEDRRAEEAQKLARQQLEQAKMVQEAQARELQAQAAQREYAMQQDAAMKSDMINLPVTVNQRGLMQSGIIDPKTRTSDPRALSQVVQGQRPQGLLGGELSQPTYQDQMGVLSKYNPEKALELQATMATAAEARKLREQQAELDRQLRREIAESNNATKLAVADTKSGTRLNAPTLKFQNDYTKASNKRDELNNQLDDIGAHADRLLNARLDRITGVIGAIPNIPGGKGADAQASLNSFKSKIGLSTLANLKSGTGAGLGQVTEAEHKLLQNYLSELENAQSEKSIRESIERIKQWSQAAKGRINKGFDRSIYGQYDRSQNGESPTKNTQFDQDAIAEELARRKRK